MEESYKLAELEKAYSEYVTDCESALRLTLARILNLQEAFSRLQDRNPLNSVTSRIKEFNSVIEKCKRKGYDISIDSIKENIRDIAGIRIITVFRDDVYEVAKQIKRVPGINIVTEKDYIKNPKSNGYSSLHLQVQIEIYSPIQGTSKLIPLEIQIRDKSMDLWASVEHIVKYKNDDPMPGVEERFQKMARILKEFADTAIELRDFSESQ